MWHAVDQLLDKFNSLAGLALGYGVVAVSHLYKVCV